MAIEGFASEVAASAFGEMMRSSAWAYPLANVAHLLGLALLAGGVLAVDLRLMGFLRKLPLKPMHDALTPFAVVGLSLFALSGAALFAADAKDLVTNGVFLAKLALVALASANAFAFRKYARGKLSYWNAHTPIAVRLAAVVSLSLWSAAIICGRMIAY